jgi:hypothetical protein
MAPLKLPSFALLLGSIAVAGCAGSTSSSGSGGPTPAASRSTAPPSPDPRVGLSPGLMDAEEAVWNLRLLSETPPPEQFQGITNSDLAFTGNYAIQGNYNGWQVWDISNPRRPSLKTGYVCPASQSDVSVYRNLLFVSGENLAARLDCGTQGVEDSVSKDRLRGLRIFDISDLANPKNVGNVQTCRGSHTHSVLVDPKDKENVYVYISGSAPVRSPTELEGCISAMPTRDPNTAWFRIEVIKVPLANPERAAIVSSPRIFEGLVAPPRHGDTREDSLAKARMVAEAKAKGDFVVNVPGHGDIFIGREKAREMLDSLVAQRGGTGEPTAQDSAALREAIPRIIEAIEGPQPDSTAGPTQCHDITLYPAIGLGGGACEGYGMLLDIRDPVNPRRIDAVSDPNFSYWHSATFNNEGKKILFSDEWGGGTQPKCRRTDKPEWGADAIFTIENSRKMRFQSYYKIPAPQTPQENCVAHNGSLIPIPGRDIMVQAWYQGGISVFDWTNPKKPMEIAFFDRGPIDGRKLESGGYWSAYWYNGVIVGSEMARGLDIFELVPSAFISQNEIDAAKSVKLDYFNTQGQVRFIWPATYSLARAYLDQLERSRGLDADKVAEARAQLALAEKAMPAERQETLGLLVSNLQRAVDEARDAAKIRTLAAVVGQLADDSQLARR